MDPLISPPDQTDLARRMELRARSDWPARSSRSTGPCERSSTTIRCTVWHLPFTETVRRGKQFLGGNGYSPATCTAGTGSRDAFWSGTSTTPWSLQARPEEVDLGSCRIAHREVLRACLTHGLSHPTDEPLDRLMERAPDEEPIDALAERLSRARRRTCRTSWPRPSVRM